MEHKAIQKICKIWLAHMISRFACYYTRSIVDVSSNIPVSYTLLL